MSKAKRRLGSWGDPIRYALQIASMGLAGFVLAMVAKDALVIKGTVATVLQAVVVFVVLGVLELLIIGRPLQRSIVQSSERSARREGKLRAEATRQEFEGRLARALDMAQDEASSLDVVDRALEMAAPGQP